MFMPSIRKNVTYVVLVIAILLIALFLVGDSSFQKVTFSPSPSSQIAAVSGAGSGLIAHYTFDDGTAADSAGSNNGTLIGGPTPVAGKVGSGALQFDGVDDVVSSGASVNVASSDQFSYSFWIKAPQTSGAPVSFGIYRACGRDGTSIRCTVDGDSSGSATVGSVYDNSWHHIVFINNGNTQTIYKDGVQGGTASEIKSTQGGVLRMGNGLSSSSFFGGQLDDVRIYDRALTPDEVGQLFTEGGGVAAPPPPAPSGDNSNPSNPSNPPSNPNPPANPPANPVAGGPDWYVDMDATGANNGTSWADAYKTFEAIKWNLIDPGDTIWVSGGIYPEYVKPLKKGTQSQPIRIKVSQEAGHNDMVTVSGFSMNDADWITIDGAKNEGYESNIGDNTFNVPLVKNNINLRVDGKLLNTYGFNMGSGGLNGFKVKWIEVTTSDDEVYGFRFNPSDGMGFENIEVAYSWIHDVGNDAVYQTQNAIGHWDVMVVHHTLIERVGDDGLEVAQGLTFHHNYMRDNRFVRGHPDGIQSTGNYQRIYANIFAGLWGNSILRIQGYADDYTGIQIYNNLFYSRTDTRLLPNPIELVWYGNQQPWNTKVASNWKDWLIVNNTFADFGQPNAFTFAKRDWLQNAYIVNLRVENNIFYNISKSGFGGTAFGIPGNSPAGSVGCCWHNSEDNTIFDYNVITKTAASAVTTFGVLGSYPNAEAYNAATKYKHNSGTVPSMVNAEAYDYRPTASDTVARNKGVNLSFLNVPGINQDVMGNPRGAGGAWDIGAFEYPESGLAPLLSENPDPQPEPDLAPGAGLVLNLDFEGDSFAGNVFADKSGNSNAADCQRNLVLGGVTKDQCPASGPGAGSATAAVFTSLGTCRMASDYLAVQKKSSIDNLSRGTISLWVKPTEFEYNNSKLLDAFTAGVADTWVIGRDGLNMAQYQLTMNDDNGVERDIFALPGGTSSQGSWNLYTITWDGSRIRGYYNGALFGDVPMTGISKFSLGGYLAIGAMKHNVARNDASATGNCINQYHDPDGDGDAGNNNGSYVFPNAGFFTGSMDNIRIYNRALSAAEVAALAQGVSVQSQYVLGVSKTGAGTGGISSSPAGIGCGKDCSEAFTAGSTVVLSAVASEGSAFTGWGGSCTGTAATCSVTMSSAKYATANFERAGTVVASFEPESLPAAQRVGFITDSTSIYQNPQANSVSTGGKLTYTFSAPAGDYLVIMKVNAPSESNNSLYVSMDEEPTEANSTWHLYTTGGFEERVVTFGSDTHGNNPVKLFKFDTDGMHTLFIRGREAAVNIDSVIILRKGAVVITPLNGMCSTVVNQCLAGTFVDVTNTAANNLWSCNGTNGGTTAQCSLPISVQTDTTPPSLISIAASNITTNSATISWTTNEPATTDVRYGLTSSYGTVSSIVTLSTTHTRTLTGLTPKKIYHYKIASADAAGNTSTSIDGTFETLSTTPQPDVDPLTLEIVPLPINIPPPNVIPAVPTPNIPATPQPSFISRFIPSFSTSKKVSPYTVTSNKTPGEFVPIPDASEEDVITRAESSLTETVRTIFSYIAARIVNGFHRIIGR